MSDRPSRIVDAHVHLWDPARTDWYPYLSGQQDIGMDATRMSRRFDVPTYQAESAGWNVERLVNVAAATGGHAIEETLELDRRAGDDDSQGHPDAIIGAITPTETVAEAVALIDRQMTAQRFRGVRPMGVPTGRLPHRDVLLALAERGLVFEILSHPDQLQATATTLQDVDGLTVVLEHVGWPRSDSDEERALWRQGIAAIAAIGPHVVCKLSGLAMPLGSMDPDVLRPWIEPAIELFGVERCMFASNFPVDGTHGTLDQLWSAFAAITAELDDAAVDQLFAGTAERVYRL